MNKEIWDIFNEKGVLTGKTTVRGRGFLKPGEYHLVVHIWVVSGDGRYLIQRRSENKKLMPGEWAATGGAAISGEDSFTAAKRELFEDLDVWLIKADPSVESLTLQESEVAEVKWVTKPELQQMIKSGRFHNYGREYFQKLFENTYLLEGAII